MRDSRVQDRNLTENVSQVIFVFKCYTIVYHFSVNTEKSILQRLASFDQMERGTLSVLRQTAHGPCCNLQRRENGRHVSEYIPADQVPLVEANLAKHDQFQSLIEEHVRLICQQSREQRLSGAKKKRPTPTSPLLKKPKSKA